MAYSAEVIRRARERLAQNKTDFESEYNRQLFEAYQQLPRLKEIDLQLRKSMTVAAQAAFIKGEDGVKAMAEVRDANLTLQREREALLEANFAPGFCVKLRCATTAVAVAMWEALCAAA